MGRYYDMTSRVYTRHHVRMSMRMYVRVRMRVRNDISFVHTHKIKYNRNDVRLLYARVYASVQAYIKRCMFYGFKSK